MSIHDDKEAGPSPVESVAGDPGIAAAVDIRAHVCPMTWVRVKLALERIGAGECLEVLLRGDEPLRNIPRSATADGHRVEATEPRGADHRLLIRKGGEGC